MYVAKCEIIDILSLKALKIYLINPADRCDLSMQYNNIEASCRIWDALIKRICMLLLLRSEFPRDTAWKVRQR